MLEHRRVVGLLLAFGFVAGAAATAPATSGPGLAAGTLTLHVVMPVSSIPIVCPPSVPPDVVDCRSRAGTARVRGLGAVSETYVWSFRMGPPTCPPDLGKPLATNARLVVAGKGELQVSLVDGARCIEQEPLRNEPQSYTITGGTGALEGASGSGTVERAIEAGAGTETWRGTLLAPALEFDLTPPTIAGASNKVVTAKKGARTERVVFRVTAQDDRDGSVPVSCTPRSGTKFKIGRTRVACEATDTSANGATAGFTVTVKRRR
ncbi:MAG TPA: HYR domain-containing protein [Gaiellaceae bacterium]|nr:HYR domain-containing protein [Gaiellaceae bacterium]